MRVSYIEDKGQHSRNESDVIWLNMGASQKSGRSSDAYEIWTIIFMAEKHIWYIISDSAGNFGTPSVYFCAAALRILYYMWIGISFS